jgi:hypothetical protein
LLRVHSKRPRRRDTAERRYEMPSADNDRHLTHHWWITGGAMGTT